MFIYWNAWTDHFIQVLQMTLQEEWLNISKDQIKNAIHIADVLLHSNII